MIRNTLVIVGPGGIGKSPLSHALRDDLHQVDPYRLRPDGPRDRNDLFYGHPNLRKELHLALAALGEPPIPIGCGVEWFPRAMALFFKVRTDWQLLLLHGRDADFGKMEIYAPALPVILGYPSIQQVFGALDVVVIHPGETVL